MKKNKFKKYFKIGLGVAFVVLVGNIVYAITTAESTSSSGIVEPEWFSDMCEDEEFYNKTHNEDESLNSYGKSLI